jgi:penicillin G amidase
MTFQLLLAPVVAPARLALLAVLALVGGLTPQRGAATPAAAVVRSVQLPGLQARAQILVDPWGVPHLYAASSDDLFFVQGFNAARDRLFQIDLWRRRGLGRLAAALGPSFVEQDRAARLFLYRGNMQAEWQAYAAGTQRAATRFVAGINAYIDLLAAPPARPSASALFELPFEFRHFGYRPEKWAPEDVVRIRSHALSGNVHSELWRSVLACRGELAADAWRQALTPPRSVRVPEGLDPCVPPQALTDFMLATQPVQMPAPGERRSALQPLDDELTPTAPDLPQGSNAWVVAPSRSATGRPLLASDPHRLQAAPSLRYLVHLEAPGLSAIGAGEPALPGVSLGHNGRIAFGLTVFGADQEDLYVYQTRAGRPDEYRYQGRWEAMRVVTERIEVRGAPAQTVRLRYTRHGPVTWQERSSGVMNGDEGGRAYAVRSVWSEPGTAPYLASLGLMRAGGHAEFTRAMAAWGTPAVNMLYADTAGDIAWAVGGRVPRRLNWDGLLPVPGDGRHEWAGFSPASELPALRNPAAGWFASANEYNLPPVGPWVARPPGLEWPSSARHQRLAEVLAAQPRSSVDDAMRLQNDVLSVPARRLQALLRPLRFGDPQAQAAQRLLLAWHLRLSADSAGAALFERWWARHLPTAFRQAVLPRNAAVLLRTTDEDALLAALEQPAAVFSVGATARRDMLLERSLASAWAELLRLAGPDPGRWQWGALHQAEFPHPLAPGTDAATRARLNVGPWPKDGGRSTVNLSVHDTDTGRHVAGPSLRLVLDVGDWDRSRAINAPGQAGDPASPHYRDLAPLWLKGGYFPLLYTRAAVEAAAVRRIELLPAVPVPRGAASGSRGR